ncbi:NADH:quinone oxidoreductase [Mangrovimonas yunxiaonensis]|uniref:Na(+)-translocating NADH-quinone reductase subunit C n=1 Tax=Mangrovimonas yunxiaonensis TaxID=1197477 RepID=A0A084TI47_9FLAO|nr:Na(+)-translocating NADH-quinone reductase subunit C [Mangrovimonas yunxiaonensis]KFB00383.1 NADH:quinone oxidoreductase [Mangrovimonas yunxiaonensis]MBR9757490.1 Na(+)-translocating NADH-quinone reductase subunit C [Algicola sp.]GGH35071.1 Na(+)-translocating NADH-quinone reductase subunit C [Mangrovimonas yunxiaonensis]
MSNKTDSNVYTVLFAIGMVIVVGALLAFTASSLKPTITKNKELEKQQNILYAMGVNENDETSANFVSTDVAPELFNKYITKQLVIQGGEVSEDNEAYLMDIKKEKAQAKGDASKRRLPLFIGEKDGKTYYIAPIRGKGLWDAVWAYIALDKNMVIQGAYFDHKGETPGLGANIKERYFMDDFIGEHLLDSNGNFKGVAITKSNADPTNQDKTDNEVDAIAGATITGDGVAAMIKGDLALYVPYFKNLNN